MARVTLKQIADVSRPENIAKNIYNEGNAYNVNHPNAVSDGDAKGRGDSGNGVIGTSIDIAKRNALLASNRYSASNPYRIID